MATLYITRVLAPLARRLMAVTACLALPACAEPPPSGPPGSRIVVGVIDAGGGSIDSALTGPTAGKIGEPLAFVVTTYGSGCLTAAGAQVIWQGLQRTVVPYDQEAAGICREYLVRYPREIILLFDRAGEGVIRVQGRSYDARGFVTLTRAVTITP